MGLLELSPQCVITGCALICDSGGKWVMGDLHRVDSTYVFNAIQFEGRTMWSWKPLPLPILPQVSVDRDLFFERRGVIVFARAIARLNAAALERQGI